MALVKTSELAKRGAIKVLSQTPEAPQKTQVVRRSQDRSRARRQKAAERIGAATEELASGVSQAAAAVGQLRRSLEQIASGAEEAAGAAHESLSATSHLSARFSDARKEAEYAQRRTEALQAVVLDSAGQLDNSILAIAASVERQMALVEIIESLRNRAEGIVSTTLTVADISDRTNLLALNAAIEAARAGDSGKGFAVVADEVRALAETAERGSREVTEHSGRIVEAVRSVANRIKTSATTSQSQSSSARQIATDLNAIRSNLAVLFDNSQRILAASAEADAAAREAQRGAEIVAAAAEEQSAATAEAQRSVQQQSAALDESQATSQSLAVLAEELFNESRKESSAEEVSSAAEQLSATVQELSGAAGEILIAVEQISRGAEAQAAATLEANAAMSQIEKSAALAQEYASAASRQSGEIAELVKRNKANVEAVVAGLSDALAETREALSALTGAGDLGFQMERAVDRIVLVAVQTSMLAVSGSVEAARAGEAGRGFALVSADIRRLASDAAGNIDVAKDAVRAIQIQTAVVQRELELTIVSAEGEISKSRLIIERLGTIVADIDATERGNLAILDAAKSILDSAQQVQSGTRQISTVAQTASAAAIEVATAAREQARAAEDLAAAVEEIASLADELQSAGS